eukprot:3998352-Pleurochrysis_carterae.AAC.1
MAAPFLSKWQRFPFPNGSAFLFQMLAPYLSKWQRLSFPTCSALHLCLIASRSVVRTPLLSSRKQVLQDRVNYRKAMRNKETSLDFLDALMAGKVRPKWFDLHVQLTNAGQHEAPT